MFTRFTSTKLHITLNRREQFEATVKKCQEENVGLSESRLQKVLLHPEDRKRSEEKQKLVQVSDKSLLSENFWKVREKRRSRRRVGRVRFDCFIFIK